MTSHEAQWQERRSAGMRRAFHRASGSLSVVTSTQSAPATMQKVGVSTGTHMRARTAG